MRRKVKDFMIPITAAVVATSVFIGQDISVKRNRLHRNATRCAIYRRMQELSAAETFEETSERYKSEKAPHLMSEEERRQWIAEPFFPKDDVMHDYYVYLNSGFLYKVLKKPPHNALDKFEPDWLNKSNQKAKSLLGCSKTVLNLYLFILKINIMLIRTTILFNKSNIFDWHYFKALASAIILTTSSVSGVSGVFGKYGRS